MSPATSADEVYEASDGIEGLKMAELHHPEIILSDVRMPRMSGIDMLYKVREHTPDTVFIFMSGYSDKEYLKAAIKLRAVNYVEKPLDLTEIEQAVRTAAERHMQIVESRRSQDLRFNMYASRLAMSLPPPGSLQNPKTNSWPHSTVKNTGTPMYFTRLSPQSCRLRGLWSFRWTISRPRRSSFTIWCGRSIFM